jgi:hypothetical protein
MSMVSRFGSKSKLLNGIDLFFVLLTELFGFEYFQIGIWMVLLEK